MRTRERIELDQIVDDPWQPRFEIDDQSADEMADSCLLYTSPSPRDS